MKFNYFAVKVDYEKSDAALITLLEHKPTIHCRHFTIEVCNDANYNSIEFYANTSLHHIQSLLPDCEITVS